MRSLSLKISRFVIVLVLTMSLGVLCQTQPALGQTIQSPKTCSLGIYLTSLRNFQTAEKSFTADFRLWSVCPAEDMKPLENMRIVNLFESETAYESTLVKKNRSKLFYPRDTVYWSQREVTATIYHNWDVHNYPFDRHRLRIQFEETVDNALDFVYTPDFTNSGYAPDMLSGEWKIIDFNITETKIPYATSFGNPEIDSQDSRYSRLVVTIKMQRTSLVNFLNLAGGVYVTAVITMVSFLLEYESPLSGRVGLLATALFGALVNMQTAQANLGTSDTVTLLDFIHIVTIAYILAASAIAVYIQILNETGQQKQALYLDRKVLFRVFTISYIVVNGISITYAAIVG